jgi:hypothetical protein
MQVGWVRSLERGSMTTEKAIYGIGMLDSHFYSTWLNTATTPNHMMPI